MSSIGKTQSQKLRIRRTRFRALQRAVFETLEDRILFSTLYWKGTSITDPSDFSRNENWFGGAAPQPGDTVIFDSSGAYSVPIEVKGTNNYDVDPNAFYVTNTNVTLNLDTAFDLHVSNMLEVDCAYGSAFFTVENTNTASASHELQTKYLDVGCVADSGAELYAVGSGGPTTHGEVFINVKDSVTLGVAVDATALLVIDDKAGMGVEGEDSSTSYYGFQYDAYTELDVKGGGKLTNKGNVYVDGNDYNPTYIDVVRGTPNAAYDGFWKIKPGVTVEFGRGATGSQAEVYGLTGGSGRLVGANTDVFASGAIEPGDALTTDEYGDLVADSCSTNPYGLLEVAGSIGASSGFSLLSTIDSSVDSNTLVVDGDLALSSCSVTSFVNVAQTDAETVVFDDSFIGNYYVLAASGALSSGFSDYTWGTPLPDSLREQLPTLYDPSHTHWELDPENAAIYEDSSYGYRLTDGDWGGYSYGGTAIELVLAAGPSDGYGYGGGGGGESILMHGGGSGFVETGDFIPLAPDLVQAAVIGNHGIHVDWESDEPAGTSFVIQRKQDDGEWVTVQVSSIPTHAWLDAGLAHGHIYTYRVQASDGEDLNSDWTEMGYGIAY